MPSRSLPWEQCFATGNPTSKQNGCSEEELKSTEIHGKVICSSGRRCFGFYFGTNTIAKRADLTKVFSMIFHRLRSAGADWLYRGLAGFIVSHSDHEWAAMESFPEERGDPADAERLRAKFDDLVARVRERILNSPPPATVRGYRQVYGREPRGWPPV